MSDDPIPRSLRDVLKGRRVIPFVGAGVSMAVQLKRAPRQEDPPAFPSWIGLLDKAADRLRDELKPGDADFVRSCLGTDPPKVLEAAGHALKMLRPDLWSSLLVECFRIPENDVDPESLSLARLLWQLGSNLLITTNYDNVLRWASPAKGDVVIWPIESPHGLAQFEKDRHPAPTVWHLHGQIDDPGRLVLTPDGYRALYGSQGVEEKYSAALTSFRALLRSHTLVFVGFSLTDEAVSAQLRWLVETFKGQGGTHFVLLHQKQVPLFKATGGFTNVEPIAIRDYGAPLIEMLERMAAIVDPGRGDGKPKLDPSDLVAIRPVVWPADLGIDIPDSLLLRPENEVVPFHAYRHPLRQEIVDWALNDPPRIALRLQAGPGGAGKSRLMIEVCRVLEREHGWRAGFLRQPCKDLEQEFRRLLAEQRNCFVVVDYAETHAEDAVALARTALHGQGTSKVRLALLARDGGDWWDHLADAAGGDKILEALLRSPATKTGPYRMTEQRIERDARASIYAEALEALAAKRGQPVPTGSMPDLSSELFGDVLFLHLAALAALHGHAVTDDLDLIDTTLGHERSYWRKFLAERRLDPALLDAVEQALALFTLAGGARSATDARELLRRAPQLRHASAAGREGVFELLRQLYRRDGGLAPLEPDLLGERLVAKALAAEDELLDIALDKDATRETALRALTALTRLARRFPAERKWLALALERYLAPRAQDAFAVAQETGAPMPELLAGAIAKSPAQTQRTVIQTLFPKLPKETGNLSLLAVEVAERRLLFIEQKEERKGSGAVHKLFGGHQELATRLEASGRHAEAADARGKALRQAEQLARAGKDTDRARLAAAQSNFATALRRIGRFEEALDEAEQSEAIWRELAERQPDAYRADWARSLGNLANYLRDLGRFEAALAKAEQAEALWRKLAERQPDAYRADWATSLGNLANHLRDLGRFEAALAKAEQAEAFYRLWTLSWRGVRQPDARTARSRRHRSSTSPYHLRDLGRFEAALANGRAGGGAVARAGRASFASPTNRRLRRRTSSYVRT